MSRVDKNILFQLLAITLLFFVFAPLASADTAYVTNRDDGTISAIDLSTNTVVNTITIAPSSENAVNSLARSPDFAYIYTLSFDNDEAYVIDAATQLVTAAIAVGDAPNIIAVTPDGSKAYVTNNTSDDITVINTDSNTVLTTISADDAPNFLAFSPGGSLLYVSQLYEQGAPAFRRVLIIDTATDVVVDEIVLPNNTRAQGIAVTPDGTRAYVAVQDDQQGVMVLDLVNNTFLENITGVDANPKEVVISSDGSQVYVTNEGDAVTVIDTATNQVVEVITGLSRSHGVALSPDDTALYVTNRGNAQNPGVANTVAIVDVTNTVSTLYITVGNSPSEVLLVTSSDASPAEQAEDLIEDVIVLDLPSNVENSYMANLQKVATFIEEGKIQPAINQLNAFINKVNQDYTQGILTQQERDDLVEAAENLIEDLG